MGIEIFSGGKMEDVTHYGKNNIFSREKGKSDPLWEK
jgi:hypothetical protein